jgi:hypothetical protein
MTLEFFGLFGMLAQMTIRFANVQLYRDNHRLACFTLLLWRFFGLSSGCVAFLMAIERYFALTKPFLYCKHFTNGLVKRLIFIQWTLVAILISAPVYGFGQFHDEKDKKCTRYRDATEPLNVVYAYIFFFVGKCFIFPVIRYVFIVCVFVCVCIYLE